jgi:predicted MFS family arabinose efflux permease
VGPFLGGLVYDMVAPGAPLWMAGAVLLVAAIAAARIPVRGRARV